MCQFIGRTVCVSCTEPWMMDRLEEILKNREFWSISSRPSSPISPTLKDRWFVFKEDTTVVTNVIEGYEYDVAKNGDLYGIRSYGTLKNFLLKPTQYCVISLEEFEGLVFQTYSDSIVESDKSVEYMI